MSKAIEAIVGGYLSLKNREALENLLAHRQKLLEGLTRVSGIDPKPLVSQIREEVNIIQAGLECLDGKVAGTQHADQVQVVQLTVEAPSPDVDKDGSRPAPAEDTTRITDLVVQPLAQNAYTEDRVAQAAPKLEQDIAQVRVLGLAVTVASAAAAVSSPVAPSGTVSGLDPGSFALCANQPVRQIGEDGKETEATYSEIDAFKSLVSVWNEEPTKP